MSITVDLNDPRSVDALLRSYEQIMDEVADKILDDLAAFNPGTRATTAVMIERKWQGKARKR